MKDEKQNDDNQSSLEDYFGFDEEPEVEPEPQISPEEELNSDEIVSVTSHPDNLTEDDSGILLNNRVIAAQ